MLGNEDGTFAPATGSPIQMPGVQPTLILMGDFLNHGKLDLVVMGNSSVFLPGNGDGTFQSAIPLTVYAQVGDFNGSGRLGIASAGGVAIQP